MGNWETAVTLTVTVLSGLLFRLILQPLLLILQFWLAVKWKGQKMLEDLTLQDETAKQATAQVREAASAPPLRRADNVAMSEDEAAEMIQDACRKRVKKQQKKAAEEEVVVEVGAAEDDVVVEVGALETQCVVKVGAAEDDVVVEVEAAEKQLVVEVGAAEEKVVVEVEAAEQQLVVEVGAVKSKKKEKVKVNKTKEEHAKDKPVDRKEEVRAAASAPPVNEDKAARPIQDACRNNDKQKQHKPAEDTLGEEV